VTDRGTMIVVVREEWEASRMLLLGFWRGWIWSGRRRKGRGLFPSGNGGLGSGGYGLVRTVIS
jgi:hypothetical protein